VLERLAGRPEVVAHPTTLVAGSTWPADESVLLTAFREAREERPDVRLVIVPHRPTEAGIRRIAAQARSLGLPAPVRRRLAGDSDQLVVVDEVGPLAFLYELGVIAYVGGGFGRAGLHSVLEPAALGLPIIVGPKSEESLDARRLEEAGALERLPADRAAAVLEAWWMEWLADAEWRRATGESARTAVEAGAGAADRCAAMVEALVETK
jgi:3-deoxy-D-manno-octulosonic-acid transferase